MSSAEPEAVGREEGAAKQDPGEEADLITLSFACEQLVEQVGKLRSLDETLEGLERVGTAAQTLVARHVTMLAIAMLSIQSPASFLSGLCALGLDDTKTLVRFLRLVHAGRIDGTAGKDFSIRSPSSVLPINGLDCLGAALTTVVSASESAGAQLMQACSRDLLAAAVGGAELLQLSHRRTKPGGEQQPPKLAKDKTETSDVSVLSNPSFSVSQSLVQTMAEAAGKVVVGEDKGGVLQMTDALAACLFSSKLEPPYRFWALQQLLKVFSVTRKEASVSMATPEGERAGRGGGESVYGMNTVARWRWLL